MHNFLYRQFKYLSAPKVQLVLQLEGLKTGLDLFIMVSLGIEEPTKVGNKHIYLILSTSDKKWKGTASTKKMYSSTLCNS